MSGPLCVNTSPLRPYGSGLQAMAFHFYWIHRLLHVPILYKKVHFLHHRNVNVGPWSGLSMHPIEHFLYTSSLCIHWIVPSDPILVIFHMLWLGPGAAMSHTGYEDLLIKDKRRLALGTFYHQLHHRYYECNYGNQEMPWDRWFGTFHDGTENSTTAVRKRKAKMHVWTFKIDTFSCVFWECL